MARERCERVRTVVRLTPLLFVLAVLSCGGNVVDKAVFPVAGQVLLEDRPVAGVLVVFHPIGTWESGTNRPYGQSDAEGRFRVTTYKPQDGAPAGEYKVAILEVQADGEDAKGQADEGGPPKKRPRAIPSKYANPETSGLRVQVRENSNELEPFRLKAEKRAAPKTPKN